MSVRAISAETGIPIGAVYRAKRQLEKIGAQKAEQKTAAISFEPPLSCVVKQEINGVRQDVRRAALTDSPSDLRAREGVAAAASKSGPGGGAPRRRISFSVFRRRLEL